MLLALALALVPQDSPAFTPAEGLELRRTFRFESTIDTERAYVDRDSLHSSNEEFLAFSVLDRVSEVQDGRVTSFTRTFEDGEALKITRAGDTLEEEEGQYELAKEEVAFEREGEDFKASGEPDQDLLDGLRVSYDFTGLLPEEAAEEWEVSLEAWQTLDLWNGAPFEWEPGLGAGLTSPDAVIEETSEGKIELSPTGTVEQDGRKLMVIDIQGTIEHHRTSFLEKDGAFSMRIESEGTTEEEITGMMIWDLEGGHLNTLVVDVEIEATKTISTKVGERAPSVTEVTREGSSKLIAKFERL